ncbi:MAG: MGMT family protein [Chloroflexi bacterium]|nr:MGMT family protein [Chloroflexota bacterium]MBI4503963.1 MGMT family protein [Chloroflexota bacterium]
MAAVDADEQFLVATPLGAAVVTVGRRGLRALDLPLDPPPLPAAPPTLTEAVRCYLAGEPADVPLDLSALPSLAQQVLRLVAAIPRGEVRTYAWLAQQIGRPHAARAVGQCVARNPLPLLIPCHRVVGTDGSLRGYRCGPHGVEMKRALLVREGAWPLRPLLQQVVTWG